MNIFLIHTHHCLLPLACWRHQMETFSALLAKVQWRGALMFSLTWINGRVNSREAGDLRRSLWPHCNTNIETGLLLTFKLLVPYKGTGYRHVEPSAATVLIIIIRFLLISFAYQIFGTHFRWAKGIFQNGRRNPVNFAAFGLVDLIVWYNKELNWIASVCFAMRNNKACC